MRIAVVGAGAIGGLLAARLADSGSDVSVLARGPALDAIRARGLRLIGEDGSLIDAPVRATAKAAELGPQDLVVLGMKAHQVAQALDSLEPLLGADTAVMTTQNGIPWWYFFGQAGRFADHRLETVDPGGTIAAQLDPRRVIASVVYPAAEVVEPGVIRHIEGWRFSLAEVSPNQPERLNAVSGALRAAGFKAPVVSDIRSEIWTKLWGNLSFNPISALTHATLADICGFPPTRQLAATMMKEAQAVAEKLGVRFKVSLEKRIAGAEGVGHHKTSMLQDVESGRPLELEALTGAVAELARLTETPAPTIETVYACVQLLARSLAVSGGRLRIEAL